MTKPKSKGDRGLEYLGVIDGEKWWRARITYNDPNTGKKRDTKKEYVADSKYLAVTERKRLIAVGKAGGNIDGERHRFGEALDLYLETIETHSSKLSRASNAKLLRERFGDWYIDALTHQHMQDYLDALPYAVPTKSSLRAVFSLAFQEAIRKRWASLNVAKGLSVRLAKSVRGRARTLAPKRSLTESEAAAYMASVAQHESPEMYLFLSTQMMLGCRFAEVSALTWDAIDMESGIVTLTIGQYRGVEGETKGKYIRQAAIDLELRGDLMAHRRSMAELQWPGWERLVFPRPWSNRRRHSAHFSCSTARLACRRAFERIGLSDMKVATHVARHTHLNIAARQQANPLLLRKMMGHASEQQQMTYTATEQAEVISIASRVGRALRSGSKSGNGSGAKGGKV